MASPVRWFSTRKYPPQIPIKHCGWRLLEAVFGLQVLGSEACKTPSANSQIMRVIAEKRDLAKGQLDARAELLEDYRAIRIKEVQAEGDVEAIANDCAVVLKQCEVLGEADIRIAQMEAEEAVFEAETAGLPEDKKREYVEFLRNQKTPFLLTGTQTLDSISHPGDKVEGSTAPAIEANPTFR